MRFDRFTIQAQRAVQEADSRAARAGHPAIEAEHVLLALLGETDGYPAGVVGRGGGRPEAAARSREAATARLPRVEGGERGLSSRARKAFEAAERAAHAAGDEDVSVEHLLPALVEAGGACAGASVEAGVPAKALREGTAGPRGGKRVGSPNAGDATQR